MKVAYIAHPIGGDVKENLRSLRGFIRNINFNYPNVVPFVPYYGDVSAMVDAIPEHRARGIKNNMALLKRPGMVDELWICGEVLSPGMKEEIIVAKHMKIPVIVVSGSHMHFQLQEFLNNHPELPQ